MPKRDAFIIPQGLQFEHTSKGVTIENQGDIVIKGSIGMKVHKLISTDGNIHIEQPLSVHEIVALNGSVSTSESLSVSTIQAKVLESAHDLTVEKRVHVSKHLLVHGDLKAPKVQSLGKLEVHGSVECDELHVESQANVQGDIRATSIQTQDALLVNGSVTCEDFHHSGTKVHLGSLSANILDAQDASVTIQKSLHVKAVRCTNLSATGEISAPTIQVSQGIDLTNAVIQADVVLSKEFKTVGEVSGKILVLEAPIQEGGHRIKGCLELADFTDLVPDIDSFLVSRGLERQGTAVTLTIKQETSLEEEESESEATSEDQTLHVNLNAIPNTGSISEESSMFHDDAAEPVIEQEDVAQPVRIAVPMIDQANSTSPSPEENIETTIVEAIDTAEDETLEVNIETTDAVVELTTSESVQDSNVEGDDIVLNTSSENDSLLDTESDLNTAVPTEAIMSEEWTYDEGASPLDVEPQSPKANPQHEAIRTDILALIDNYDYEAYPSAIRDLLEYLETEDYLTLRDELRHIWSELLKHHQQEGSRIPSNATIAFTNLGKSLQAL